MAIMSINMGIVSSQEEATMPISMGTIGSSGVATTAIDMGIIGVLRNGYNAYE